MAGKINAFNLGALGVNVVNSPLHLPDGAWRTLQNGEFGSDESQGGIKKRGSLTKINSVALAGAVKAMVNVPFPLTSTKYLMLATNLGETETWKRSTDGAAFTDIAEADMVRALQNKNIFGMSTLELQTKAVTFGRSIYFPGNDYTPYNGTGYTAPTYYTYDGNASYMVFRVPNAPGAPGPAFTISDQLVANGVIYISVLDPGASVYLAGRVLSFNPVTGTLEQIGNAFGDATLGAPVCIAWYQGRLWAGLHGNTGTQIGRIYSIDPFSETTWVQETTGSALNAWVTGLYAFQGKLYAAFEPNNVGTVGAIWSRTSAGVWAASFTESGAGTQHYQQTWAEWEDTNGTPLLFYGRANGASTVCEILRYNGSGWAVDLDIDTAYAAKLPATAFLWEDNLYWVCHTVGGSTNSTTCFLLKRDIAGTWTQPIAAAGLRGGLGQVMPDA
jgi:hypothetical protein